MKSCKSRHDVVVYETSAITRYVDEAFEGPDLQPSAPQDRARLNQIISVIDSYAYWPLVRQVFSHGAFRKRMSLPSDDAELQRGLDAAPKVLAALEQLAGEGGYLIGERLSLADLHLAPMIGYFTLVAEADALLMRYPRLGVWWSALSQRRALMETRPQLPNPPT